MLDATKQPNENVIPFQNEFNEISPCVLDEIFEGLEDIGYLSDKGKEFRTAFWKLFIRKRNN